MSPALGVIIVSQIIRLAMQNGKGPPSKSNETALVGAWGAFVWFVLVPAALMLVPFVLAGQVYLLAPIAAVALLTFPWPFARHVLVPLRLPRAAYWLAYTSDCLFRLDRPGAAALAGAWALAHAREPDEEGTDFIAGKLAGLSPLRGAGVLASGMLLAARGDLAGARLLVECAADLDDRACPPAAKRLARGWLVADAARRGEWEAITLMPTSPQMAGRGAWLVAGVARALLLEPTAPSRLGLWMRWLLAPNRRATIHIVRRALDAMDGAFIEPEEEAPIAPSASAAGGADPLRTALSLHATVLAQPMAAVRIDDLRTVGRAWDDVLEDRALERRLLERALVLGASGATSALADLRSAIEEDLAALVSASGLPLKTLSEGGAMVARIRVRMRDELLTEVEAASDAIRRRADEKRALPMPDEWREWAAFRALYERGVARAGDEFRRLAFAKVHTDACNLAVWHFNERKERPLGNAIFRFLLTEAEALDDARAIGLQAKNVACGV